VNDRGAREAVLGLKPVFKVSKIFEEYEAETRDQVLDLSPDQLRMWGNARKRVIKSFESVVGDKLITELAVGAKPVVTSTHGPGVSGFLRRDAA